MYGWQKTKRIHKQDAALPTISLDSIFITSVIEAHENSDVAVIDLPVAFLHAKLEDEDEVIMVMQGHLAELMVMTEPKVYMKYVTINKRGQTVLYIKLQKALYGFLKSALLFNKKLLADLVATGFEPNPYDPCVVNKIIDGKQMTIAWHVDDLKVSHHDPEKIDELIKYLASIYGMITMKCGRVHEYLGMILDYKEKEKLKVTTKEYTKNTRHVPRGNR